VTLRSTSAEIKSAYYKLAKKYHPDRFRQPEQAELKSKVEALFAKVTEAYETLSDTPKRALYDDRLRKGQPKRDQAPSSPLPGKGSTPIAHVAAVPKRSNATGPLPSNGTSTPTDSSSTSASSEPAGPDPAAEDVISQPLKPPATAGPGNPGVTSEFCYQQ